ncbi:hypothetical protein QJV45_13990 [Listeria booriae]|uniref:hypothetical protein n=1 Tax=Listeria booriae TaxID=1552123 RepID=UPI00287FF983|nr:hypothetical protein [Listeria booriae]MDT0111589.1 hypothetical protein [Listeria booriae]
MTKNIFIKNLKGATGKTITSKALFNRLKEETDSVELVSNIAGVVSETELEYIIYDVASGPAPVTHTDSKGSSIFIFPTSLNTYSVGALSHLVADLDKEERLIIVQIEANNNSLRHEVLEKMNEKISHMDNVHFVDLSVEIQDDTITSDKEKTVGNDSIFSLEREEIESRILAKLDQERNQELEQLVSLIKQA